MKIGGILISTKETKMKFRDKYPLVIPHILEVIEKLEELGLDDEIAKLKQIMEDIENE